MHKPLFAIASIAGALAVAIGAFGAHALSGRLDEKARSVYQTASLYHLVHAVALLAVAMFAARSAWAATAGYLFAAGIVIFSGTLYALAITGHKWLGAITPIGGMCLIAGWIALAVAAFRLRGG